MTPEALPGLPRDAGGPVFDEPWQAQAFAMVVHLNEIGQLDWSDWAARLSEELKAAGPDGGGAHYYDHWLAALEKLVKARGLLDAAALEARKQAWALAYEHTPHGQPVELSAGFGHHHHHHHDHAGDHS